MPSLSLLSALALTAAASVAGVVLIPLAIALFLSILLEPLVAWGESRGVRRGRGAGLVVAGFLLAALASAWAFSRPFSLIASDMPRYSQRIRAAASALDLRALSLEKRTASIDKTLRPEAPSAAAPASTAEGAASLSQFLWRGIGSFFEAAGIAAFVPFLMIAILGEKELLVEGFERLAGGTCDVGHIARETPRMVRAYFCGNVVAGAALVFLHWLVFAALGLKNAVGLGLITGFVTLIPMIGLPGALLLPTAQALLQFNTAAPFAALASALTVLHVLTANYVVPRAIGASVRIGSTAALLGLLFWGWLWGATGFVLAVPLTALLKILLESRRDTRAWADLLCAKPPAARGWLGRRLRWPAAARTAAPIKE